jgi:hypothetical protein
MNDIGQRVCNIYVVVITGVAMVLVSILLNIRDIISEKNLVISGQQSVIDGNEATIAAYKENLTSCLKDSKVAAQDEFTGE